MIKASTTYRIVKDHLGSPLLVVNASSGAVVQTIEYDEWGNATESGTQPLPFGFAGGLWDRDTNLVRFGARDYDPATGRWTTKDSSRFRGGLNLYAYAYNNPINYIDPTGLRPIVDTYRTPTGAAYAALSDIEALNAQQRVSAERGGWIYQNPDGTFSYTPMRTGTADGLDFGDARRECPASGYPSGSYHSHLPGHLDGPSPTDFQHANAGEFFFGSFTGYIAGPDGQLVGFNRHGVQFSIPAVFSPYDL